MAVGELLHNRQFYVADHPVDHPDCPDLADLGSSWRCVSRNVSVTVARCPRGSLAGIGELLDPDRPGDSNGEILARLLDAYLGAGESSGYGLLEDALDSLAGRFVLFADLDAETRAYPDAFGSYALMYAEPGHGDRCFASSPQLILDCQGLDAQLTDPHFPLDGGKYWPGTLTAVKGVRRVLPNHYLDLTSRETRRYWPRDSGPAPLDVDAAAPKMVSTLGGTLEAAANRWKLQIGLTAGYDSRLLAAVAATRGISNVETFTQARVGIDETEWVTAGRVADVLGLSHRVIDPAEARKVSQKKRAMRANGGSANLDGVMFSVNVDPAEMLLTGHCEEALRHIGIGYRTPDEIRTYAANSVDRRLGGGAEGILVEVERWLRDAPYDAWFSLADLYTWEMFWGPWLPTKFAGLSTLVPVMAPQNCRRFQMEGFATPTAERGVPNQLLRRIYEIVAPELLEIPFNFGDQLI